MKHYVALHTAQPDPNDQTVHEASYPNYARQEIDIRDAGPDGVLACGVMFPTSHDCETTFTHLSISTQPSGPAKILHSGLLIPNIRLDRGFSTTPFMHSIDLDQVGVSLHKQRRKEFFDNAVALLERSPSRTSACELLRESAAAWSSDAIDTQEVIKALGKVLTVVVAKEFSDKFLAQMSLNLSRLAGKEQQ